MPSRSDDSCRSVGSRCRDRWRGDKMVERVIVVGGGPIGLALSLLLAADGREVTVLEKDSEGPPATIEEAFGSWKRAGVAQFRQAHYLQPRFCQLLDAHLPAVRERLEALGGRRVNLLSALLRNLSDNALRPDDDRFETVTARRPIVEQALAEVADATAGVQVRRGVGVEGALSGSPLLAGVPHVTGVRTDNGTELTADLVVDATGRRSKLTEWVTQLGGRPPYEE